MLENLHAFGSPAWAKQMFSDPPARIVKGRMKWTHRHAPLVDQLGRLAFVESRNELIGLLALQYLNNIKAIRLFKEQPFTASEQQVGQEYTPDFAAQSLDRRLFVHEIKTERYISREMERKHETLKERFAEYGMAFLVWTDLNPLTCPLRHNLLRLRRASAEFIEPDETARLIATLQEKGPTPLWALYNLGLDIDLIANAAWRGEVFLPLRSDIGAASQISIHSQEDLVSVLFGTEPDIHKFWNSLEDAI